LNKLSPCFVVVRIFEVAVFRLLRKGRRECEAAGGEGEGGGEVRRREQWAFL
jgi:hypothetical protein